MYRVTLERRVRDRVEFVDGNERIRLTVSAESTALVSGLQKSMERLKTVTEDSDEQERVDAALSFAGAIFGEEQARRLLEFYQNDCGSVVAACTKYFNLRLAAKIADAQRKMK